MTHPKRVSTCTLTTYLACPVKEHNFSWPLSFVSHGVHSTHVAAQSWRLPKKTTSLLIRLQLGKLQHILTVDNISPLTASIQKEKSQPSLFPHYTQKVCDFWKHFSAAANLQTLKQGKECKLQAPQTTENGCF